MCNGYTKNKSGWELFSRLMLFFRKLIGIEIDMHILITGASGFLGKSLVPILSKQGHQVIGTSSKTCDLLDPNSLDQFEGEIFDRIFDFAVWTQAGDFSKRCPGEQWLINQKTNTHLLDWWQRKQPQAKMITIGTSCAYDPAFEMSEENYFAGTPMSSFFAYGMVKRMLLTGLEALRKQYGLEYVYAVPSTLYGIEGYHTDGRQLHFIFDLIRKILRGKLYGEKVTLWGDGEQKREIVHVSDFLEALLHLADHEKNQIFNIGEGREHSIKEFARLICEEVGYPISRIEYDPSGFVGARSKILSIGRLKASYPTYAPRLPSEGIREIASWLLQNPKLLNYGTTY